MNHEPDCFYQYVLLAEDPLFACGGCITAKNAYKRGFEEATREAEEK
jgi:hypothetical protein